jgi:hypothetical protein
MKSTMAALLPYAIVAAIFLALALASHLNAD